MQDGAGRGGAMLLPLSILATGLPLHQRHPARHSAPGHPFRCHKLHPHLHPAPQVKTIWSVLLRNFEFELVDPFPEPNYESMVIMPKPCRVRYTRRKLAPAK